MIEIEVTSEIWRTSDFTFVVMYPLPNTAYIKGFRGKYTRKIRDQIKEALRSKGVVTVHYERRKNGSVLEYKKEG